MRRLLKHMTFAFVAVLLATGTLLGQQRTYPSTNRVDQYDDYHGEQVHDPYRWLEDDARESEEVATWVEAQNEVTFDFLKSIPQGRLGARRGAVDLVGKDDAVKDGPALELEGALLAVVYADADDVRRQQVRRALDAGE